MKERIRVGIIEDEAGIRHMLEKFVQTQDDLECLITAHSVEDFLDAFPAGTALDVLIQDIGLPGISGLEAISLVKDRHPEVEVLMYSIFEDSEGIFKAFCAGASGYILKNSRLADIRKAILDVHRGQAAMSPSIAKKVIAYFQPRKVESPLTDKEQMVVQLLTDGLSYKMVAERLQISMNTVRSHIRNIYAKLQVNSKAEVIARKLKGEI